MLDIFNALTLHGKIAVLAISGIVVVTVYLMFKILKKPESKIVKDDDAVAGLGPTMKSEATVDSDKVFEEGKSKLKIESLIYELN